MDDNRIFPPLMALKRQRSQQEAGSEAGSAPPEGDDFDFEKEEPHEIFQMTGVVADSVAIDDLKVVIAKLSDAVMAATGIGYGHYRMLGGGGEWSVPEGTKKFKARLDDINGFVAHIDKPGVPVVIWSTFRKLVLGFSKIHGDNDIRAMAVETLTVLNDAAMSSGFLLDTTTDVYVGNHTITPYGGARYARY